MKSKKLRIIIVGLLSYKIIYVRLITKQQSKPYIRTIQQQMSTSRTKKQNYSDLQAGQTLFDFLKRKKKFALELSVSKSRQKQNVNSSNINQSNHARDNNTHRDHNNQSVISPHKKYEQTYRDTLRQSHFVPSVHKNQQETYRSSYCAQMNTTTPKRVSFMDQRQKKPSMKSSFIQMISPLKRKAGGSKTPQVRATDRQISQSKQYQRLSTPHNPQQKFYRKNLNNSINVLKNTLEKFLSLSTTIKQKSHTLFIQLKPLLKFVEESSNSNFSKRAEQVKLKLRTFEHLFKENNIENGNQIFQQFQRSLSQHLMSLESNIRSSFEKEHVEMYKKLREQKDNKVLQLGKTNEKLEKEVETLQRKLDRFQKQSEKQKQTNYSKLQKGQQFYCQKISNLEEKIQQYQEQINVLAKELDSCKQTEKQLQKSVKDYKYLKQEAERRFIEQNIKIKSNKQEFLLNQISIIKKQFKNDMEQLTVLYSAKEKQHLTVIEQLRLQLAELYQHRSCDKQIQTKILGDAVSSKQQAERYRKQNDCLVTDLHRMNQELYQHWLALKDIKTLAVRLQIFNKFGKIYQDLAYNDQLFI